MCNCVTDYPKIDTEAIKVATDLKQALAPMLGANRRFDYSMVAFTAMVMLVEYTPGVQMGCDKISFDNPLQGLLFHWLIKDFLCA